MTMIKLRFFVGAIMLAALAAFPVLSQEAGELSFFITSAGPGDGANLGGLDGADRHCTMLAQAVGAGGKTWHAYLSTSGPGGVNARDRIGSGPWANAKGVQVAANVDELHYSNVGLTKETQLNEKGEMVNGRSDDPNQHDILTGSQLDGTRFTDGADHTCGNWTSSGDGSAPGRASRPHGRRPGGVLVERSPRQPGTAGRRISRPRAATGTSTASPSISRGRGQPATVAPPARAISLLV